MLGYLCADDDDDDDDGQCKIKFIYTINPAYDVFDHGRMILFATTISLVNPSLSFIVSLYRPKIGN